MEELDFGVVEETLSRNQDMLVKTLNSGDATLASQAATIAEKYFDALQTWFMIEDHIEKVFNDDEAVCDDCKDFNEIVKDVEVPE